MLINGVLAIFDRRAGTGDQAVLGLDWAYWLIIFWGFGLIGHAIYVFFGDYRVQRLYEKDRELVKR